MVSEIFYLGRPILKRSTLQWAADHYHQDKTTRLIAFHSLENLIIHSYWSKIVAILKLWIQQQNCRLCMYKSDIVSKCLSGLISV